MYVIPPTVQVNQGGMGRALQIMEAARQRREQQARQQEIRDIAAEASAGLSGSRGMLAVQDALMQAGYFGDALRAGQTGAQLWHAERLAGGGPGGGPEVGSRAWLLAQTPEARADYWAAVTPPTPEQAPAVGSAAWAMEATPEERARLAGAMADLRPERAEPTSYTAFLRRRGLEDNPENYAAWRDQEYRLSPAGRRPAAGTRTRGAGGGVGSGAGLGMGGFGNSAHARQLNRYFNQVRRDPLFGFSLEDEDLRELHAFAGVLEEEGHPAAGAFRATLPLLPDDGEKLNALLRRKNELEGELDDPAWDEIVADYGNLRRGISPLAQALYDPEFGLARRVPPDELRRMFGGAPGVPGAAPGVPGAAAPAAAPAPAREPQTGAAGRRQRRRQRQPKTGNELFETLVEATQPRPPQTAQTVTPATGTAAAPAPAGPAPAAPVGTYADEFGTPGVPGVPPPAAAPRGGLDLMRTVYGGAPPAATPAAGPPGASPPMGMMPAIPHRGPSVPLQIAAGAPPVVQGPPRPGPFIGPAPEPVPSVTTAEELTGIGPIPHSGPSVPLQVAPGAPPVIQGPPRPGPFIGPAPDAADAADAAPAAPPPAPAGERQQNVAAEVRDLAAAASNPDTPPTAFEAAKKRYLELRDGLEPEVAAIVDPAFGVNRKPPRGRKRGKVRAEDVFLGPRPGPFIGPAPEAAPIPHVGPTSGVSPAMGMLPAAPHAGPSVPLQVSPDAPPVVQGPPRPGPFIGPSPDPAPFAGPMSGVSPGMGMAPSIPHRGPSTPLKVAPGAPPVIQGPPRPGPQIGPSPAPIPHTGGTSGVSPGMGMLPATPHRGPTAELQLTEYAEELIAAAQHPAIPKTAYEKARAEYMEIRDDLRPEVREVGDRAFNVRRKR